MSPIGRMNVLPSPSPFRRSEVAAAMTIAMLTGVTTVLQPILLGGLATAGHLSMLQIGQAATLESLGMAIATGVSGAVLRPERLREIAIIATLVLLVANMTTMIGSSHLIIGARFVSGLATGFVLWIYVGLLARVPLPARVAAIQSLTMGSLALTFSFIMTLLMPRWGSQAGYFTLVLFNGTMLALVYFLPGRYEVIKKTAGKRGLPPLRGMVALASIGLQNAAITSVWIYAIPIGRAAGISSQSASFALTCALAFKLIGAASAMAIASRLKAHAVLLGTYTAIWLISALLLGANGLAFFAACLCVLTFMWMCGNAFQMPLLIAADPSGRAPMQIITAQLIGLSIGPSLASLVTASYGARGAPFIGMVLMLLSILSVLWVVSTASQPSFSKLEVP
jgi:MFS transporter, DHA1 family, inner membrane transport protein